MYVQLYMMNTSKMKSEIEYVLEKILRGREDLIAKIKTKNLKQLTEEEKEYIKKQILRRLAKYREKELLEEIYKQL